MNEATVADDGCLFLFYLILPYSTLFYPFLSSHFISLPLAKIVKKGINIVLGVKKV